MLDPSDVRHELFAGGFSNIFVAPDMPSVGALLCSLCLGNFNYSLVKFSSSFNNFISNLTTENARNTEPRRANA